MKKDNLDSLANMLFFNKESLRQLEPNKNSLDFNVKYWSKKKIIIPLKKGFYVLKSRYESENNKDLYLEYLANKLREPSYISCEYVMSKFGLLTEAVYGLTSITTNTTKTYINDLGKFSYYSITSRLFIDYEIRKFYSATILFAKKPKAIFDYLYLRFLKSAPINEKSIEELRINWDNVSYTEFKKIKKYINISKSRRIAEVINLIKKKYYA